MRRIAIAACVAACVGAGAASAQAAPGDVSVVADHLNNPRGIEVTADGTVYVAEAGKSGATCFKSPMGELCGGFTGAITRVRNGTARRVARGLVSTGGPDGSFSTGPDDVAVAPNGQLYAIETGTGCMPLPPQIPGRIARQLGRLLRVGARPPRAVANVEPVECRSNPDGTDKNANPYAVLALGKGRYVVADAGGNTLLSVVGRRVRVLAVMPKNGKAQSVPTSIARGPDGAYYVGELAEGAGPGKARVLRVEPGQKPTVFQTGFTQITGIAFGPEGSLYVTQLSSKPGRAPSGAVVRVAPDGTRTTLGEGELFFPAGAGVDAQGDVYVSNWSVLPARTPRKGPFMGANGQLVRIAAS